MARPTKLDATQVRAVTAATAHVGSVAEQTAIINAIDAVIPVAATATTRGTVLKAATVANAAGANPTKAEYDGLLTSLRNAGIIT